MMVFNYWIGNGLTAGLVVHPPMKAMAGLFREVSAWGWVLAALSASYLT